MFIAGLITIAKRQKPKCLSNDGQINKMWYIYTTEYYLAIKINEVVMQATTWMNLENVMLSERSQTQKDSYCMIPFI